MSRFGADEITFREDILDSRQIVKRKEELDDEREPWTVGKNMPGFMPDSEPFGASDWDNARDSLVEDIQNYIDELDDAEDKAIIDSGLEVIARLNALAPDTNAEQGMTVGAFHFWISRAENDGFDDSDKVEEYKNLCEAIEQGEGYGDWDHGETLIHESYFEDYARDLARDIGAISGDEQWPCNCIDWEKAANELKVDYTEIEVDGQTYLMRS